MGTDRIRIATVIVSYKSEKQTADYITKELGKVGTRLIIVVVNNASTAGSCGKLLQDIGGGRGQIINDIRLPVSDPDETVFVINNPENSGYARGNNLGARFLELHFNIGYVVFSNDDIRITDPCVIEALAAKLESLPDAGAIGPNITGLDGKPQNPHVYIPFWQRMLFMPYRQIFRSFVKARPFDKDKAEEGYYYHLMGSFFMVRFNAFKECGMFDPHTFLYIEEQILAERMLGIGMRQYYYPQVTVVHVHGGTANRFSNTKIWHKNTYGNLRYYYRKYRHVNVINIKIALVLNTLHYWLMITQRRFLSHR